MQATPTHDVFIVDDSAPIRARLVEELATIEGTRLVGEAADARAAIAGILRTRPQWVLLDLNLMGRTGLEVMRSVLAIAPAIVFVVITNHSEPQYRRASELAGASYFLDKTHEFGRIREVFAELAARH